MSAYLPRILHLRSFSLNRTPVRPLARALHHSMNNGKRAEGEHNMKKHYDTRSTSPSSARSEFDPKRQPKLSADPQSNSDDCAPHEENSGDYNQSGMRTAEYRNVDKQQEPYSPPGGEHRYGGTRRLESDAGEMEWGSKG